MKNVKYDDVSALKEATDSFWSYLAEVAYPVSKDKFRLPLCIEPFTLSEMKMEKIQKDLKLIMSAVKKIASSYYDDSVVREIFNVDERELPLIDASKNDDFNGVLRADLFFSSKVKMIELNTDYSDGLFMHDKSVQGIVDELSKKTRRKFSLNMHADLFESYLNKDETIFIAHDEGRTFVDEFYLFKNELIKRGYENVVVGKIEDSEFKDGSLFFENRKIDVVRRCFEIYKIRENKELVENLSKVIDSGKVRVINSFRMRLLDFKSIFSILNSEKFRHMFSDEEYGAIKRMIPETKFLDECNFDEIVSNKKNWVLKANDLDEGVGVFLGEDYSADEFRSLIEERKGKRNWILQRKVKIPESNFRYYEGDKLVEVKRKFDFNPHMFLHGDDVEFGHTLCRFSESNILNVKKGGGITYALVNRPDEKKEQDFSKMESQEDVWDRIAEEWHERKQVPSVSIAKFFEDVHGNVLDLGSGSGRHMPEKLDGKYYMLDLSSEMLEHAKDKAKTRDFEVETIHASMANIPIEDDFFDFAISISSLHSVPGEETRKKAISELYRVMKKGATAYIGVWNVRSERFKGKTKAGEKEKLIGWGDKGDRYYYLYGEDEVHGQFRDAGFEVLSSHNSEMMINFVVRK
jgi:ubiquinone/menaquinone biosynthesis C-methylase UbiE